MAVGSCDFGFLDGSFTKSLSKNEKQSCIVCESVEEIKVVILCFHKGFFAAILISMGRRNMTFALIMMTGCTVRLVKQSIQLQLQGDDFGFFNSYRRTEGISIEEQSTLSLLENFLLMKENVTASSNHSVMSTDNMTQASNATSREQTNRRPNQRTNNASKVNKTILQLHEKTRTNQLRIPSASGVYANKTARPNGAQHTGTSRESIEDSNVGDSTDILPSDSRCTAPLKEVRDQTFQGGFTKIHASHGVPKVIHMTSKSRCMTEPYASNVDRWRWSGYGLRVHDDESVNHFLLRNWSAYFPRLSRALRCLPREGESSAAKADMWRYLLLWQQGGIYTDIDNAPGDQLVSSLESFNLTTVDSLIALNWKSKLGQSFMVIAPHHPIMFLCIQRAVQRLLTVENLATLNTWKVTGPDVLDSAFAEFIGQPKQKIIQDGVYGISSTVKEKLQSSFPKESWMFNRTIHVIGGSSAAEKYVRTSVFHGSEKEMLYNLTGMSKWQGERAHKSNLSCQSWLAQSNGSTLS
eukprot:scaffold5_cov169-Amphora_coffeaeformis.AAC.12